MHSFWADPANSHYTDQNSSGADQLRRRSAAARWRVCCAYVRTLALLAISASLLGPVAGRHARSEPPPNRAGAQAARSHPAFAVSQFDLSKVKQRLTRSSGIPKAAARTSSAGAAPAAQPVAELEIYRPGGEFDQAGSTAGDLAARMDPAGARELEAAGVIDSKFGTVTLLRRSAAPSRPLLPRLHQAPRRAAICGSPAGHARATTCRPGAPRSAAC